ncbi:MAG: DUF805 domain-containing protein [Candidatus Gracilibacteria bacterium]|nr:DUF805 domain-containing protein [Candidatus Gracilibacteria bacterium]
MDTITELEKLAQLKEKGILSDEEFQVQKKKVLDGEVQSKGDNYLRISFSHKGRIDRTKFVVQILLLIIYCLLFSGIIKFILSIGIFPFYINPIIEYICGILIGFSFFYLSIVLTIKRLHDYNESGWNILYIFFPFIFPIIDWSDIKPMNDGYVAKVVIILIVILFLILIATPGNTKDNRFGPPPK